MRKLLIWALVVLVIAGAVGGLLWWRQRRASQDTPEILRSAQIQRGNLVLSVSASGSVAPQERTDLLTRISGKVDQILVQPNEHVKAGQVLATYSTDALERSVRQADLAVAQAKLTLETKQAAADPEEVRLAELAVNSAAQALEVARIGKQTAQIDGNAQIVQAQRQREAAFSRWRDATGDNKTRAETALTDAQAQERIAHLNAETLLKQADSQWQTAYTQYQQAQTNLDNLKTGPSQDEIRQAELQVEQAKLRLEQAQRSVEEARITAPHGGIVADIALEEGTQQRAGEPAFTILDDSAYYLDVTIDEIDIGSVAVGQDAEITLDSYPDTTLTGTVDRIAPTATDLAGLVAYNVRLVLQTTSDVRILDGMTASVRIQTGVIPDVLLIPNWAVLLDQTTAETYCYRLVNGVPTRTVIELGERNDTYTEVTSGLSAGDTVALLVQSSTLLQDLSGGRPSGGSPFGN